MKNQIILFISIVFLALTSSLTTQAQAAPFEEGKASYYADKYHGKATASGETFDKRAMTAAHQTLKFGTLVRVTNKSNGLSVIVKINDRGPFVKQRIIDLSEAAAEKISMINRGTADVIIEVMEAR